MSGTGRADFGPRSLADVTAMLAVLPAGAVIRIGDQTFSRTPSGQVAITGAVLIDGVPLAGAATMLDRARADLAERSFRDRETGKPLRRITLSAGVIALRPGETLGTALARADELLYTAKGEGRDRVCTA